jgi:hypothetical protein
VEALRDISENNPRSGCRIMIYQTTPTGLQQTPSFASPRSRSGGKSLLFAALLASVPGVATKAMADSDPLTSVRLSWDANPEPDVVGYRVYYGGSSGTYTDSIDVSAVTTAEVAGLLVGANYYFVVVAFNQSGLESDFSDELSVLAKAASLPVGAVPAQIGGFSRIDGKTMGFDIVGGAEVTELRIYGSSDLKEWELLETVSGSVSAKVLVQDPEALGAPRRFYRLESRF